MSDEDDVQMYPIKCDAECGRILGWSDSRLIPDVLLCTHCMDHPDEVEKRLGVS